MAAIIVLGQGRSGTSTVAGVLHHLGVYMGEGLLPSTPDNARGSFEDARFWQIHMEMIGGDWRKPAVSLPEGVLDRYRYLVESREEHHDLWGIKDPKLCYTFPILPLFVKHAKVIYLARRDDAILKSLTKLADVHSEKEAKLIAERYHFALWLAIQLQPKNWPSIRVEYDLLVECPEREIQRIADFVGASVAQEALDFVDPKLRHWG